MSRLYRFVIQDEKIKSLEDFLTQSQDGLSPTVHKGWLSVKRKGSTYEMHFTSTHPLKLRNGYSTIAYCQYPNNTVDNIFYQIKEGKGLPMVRFQKH